MAQSGLHSRKRQTLSPLEHSIPGKSGNDDSASRTMSSNNHDTALGRIRRAAALAELRMRLSRALSVAPAALTLGLAAAAVVLGAHKLAPERVSEPHAYLLFSGIAALVVIAHGVAFFLRLPP